MTLGLRERLADAPAALPLAEAVIAQLTGPAGAYRDAPSAERTRVTELLVDLLLTADDRSEAPLAARLMDQHALVAALFQNAELLYEHRFPRADSVGRVVMRVIGEWHSLAAGKGE